MRDVIAVVAFLAMLVALWGVIRPFRGYSRKQWLGITAAAFVIWVVAIPPQTPEQRAAAEKQRDAEERAEAAEKQKEEAATASAAQDKIVAKAAPGIAGIVKYDRADSTNTYKAVGASAFKRLNELEPGAFYFAAESEKCDEVSTGAVSQSASRKGEPKWFVDCKNGNRFIVTRAEAEEGVARFKAKKLAAKELEESCTQDTVAMCSATKAQKEAKESAVVSTCDILLERALVGDSDMDWGWSYSLGDDDDLRVVRNFKAENAFGAKLKHQYVCKVDAPTGRVKSLVINGPFGSQKVI